MNKHKSTQEFVISKFDGKDCPHSYQDILPSNLIFNIRRTSLYDVLAPMMHAIWKSAGVSLEDKSKELHELGIKMSNFKLTVEAKQQFLKEYATEIRYAKLFYTFYKWLDKSGTENKIIKDGEDKGKKHLDIVMGKLCSYVGVKYSDINTKEPGWYSKYSWTKEQESNFKLWFLEYLKGNKEARQYMLEYSIHPIKQFMIQAVNQFVFKYGWKIKEKGI